MTGLVDYLPEHVDPNCGVYMIRNMRNGKKYIGSTKDARQREKNHFEELRANRHHCDHLQNAWNLEDDTDVFQFVMFIYCKKEDLLAMEQSCFDVMKPEYNSSLIAGRPEHTAAVRAKMKRSKAKFLATDGWRELPQYNSEQRRIYQLAFAQTEEGAQVYEQVSKKHLEFAASTEGMVSYSIRSRKTGETLKKRAQTPEGKAQMRALGEHNRQLCQTEYGKQMAKDRARKSAEKRKAKGSQSGINHWTVKYKAAHYHGA